MKFRMPLSGYTGRFSADVPHGIKICTPQDVVRLLREHEVDYDCVLSVGTNSWPVQLESIQPGEDPVRDVLRAVLASGEYGVPSGLGNNIDFIAQRCIIVRHSTSKDIAKSGLTAEEVAKMQSGKPISFSKESRGVLTEADIDLIKAVRPALRSCDVRLSDYIRFLPGGTGWSAASLLSRETASGLLGFAFRDWQQNQHILPYAESCD